MMNIIRWNNLNSALPVMNRLDDLFDSMIYKTLEKSQNWAPEVSVFENDTKEKIKSINPQWGHVFDPVTGKPAYLTLWEKEDIAKYAFKR